MGMRACTVAVAVAVASIVGGIKGKLHSRLEFYFCWGYLLHSIATQQHSSCHLYLLLVELQVACVRLPGLGFYYTAII